jgi:filamentous hemagglutinin family protein
MLITKLSQMSGIEILVRSISISLGLLSVSTLSASAEITATTGVGSTGTTFAPGATNTIDITGGQKSSDKTNLFHSFGKFNVDAGQVANFKPDVGIQNILGRVTDGASLINGGIQVNGGSTTSAVNLFLMNPAGIVFGKGASLDINGAFTATTAKAIDFNGKWFNALGTNNYSELNGNPIGFAFTGGTPGSIFSAATFDGSDFKSFDLPVRTTKTAKPGQNITLVGGTVISTGDIKTAGGNISIATVEGGKYVQIKSDGSILRLDLPASATNITPQAKAFTAVLLPQLLTNTEVDLAATGVKNEKGIVTLVGNPAAVAAVKVSADKDNVFAIRAATAVGDPDSVASDINRGDTISKQNRSISSGDVITRNLDTSKIIDGGNIHIESSKAILSGNINTDAFRSSIDPATLRLGGTVVLNAQTELKAKGINTSAVPQLIEKGYKGGDVKLSTKTKDIIVDSIFTNGGQTAEREVSKADSEGLRGGNVTINSVGLFRVITTGGISSSLFGVINIKHGSKKPFASGVTFQGNQGKERTTEIPGFIFPDGASGSKGAIATSTDINGSLGTVYKNQPIDGNTIAANNTLATSTAKKDPKDNSAGSPDDQASKPGDSEEGKQKGKCTKNSSAIASAKLGTDPTRSGNSANAAAEEFCPPNNSNSGILQILTDRN